MLGRGRDVAARSSIMLWMPKPKILSIEGVCRARGRDVAARRTKPCMKSMVQLQGRCINELNT